MQAYVDAEIDGRLEELLSNRNDLLRPKLVMAGGLLVKVVSVRLLGKRALGENEQLDDLDSQANRDLEVLLLLQLFEKRDSLLQSFHEVELKLVHQRVVNQ